MISVCIASYNGEKYIGKQIESIVEQLGCDDELIVSDDGSTDATREVVASFGDGRIRLIDHSSLRPKRVKYAFEYVTHNFDYALRHTRGDLIFLADQHGASTFFSPTKTTFGIAIRYTTPSTHSAERAACLCYTTAD